jgi:small-conductance mechanosensitive channel
MMLLAASPAAVEACGDPPGLACEWAFDLTDSTRVAQVVSWLVDRPFRLLVIIVAAVVVNRLARRAITRLVERLARQQVLEVPMMGRAGALLRHDRGERARQRALTMGALLRSIATAVIASLAGLMALSELGIDLAPLIAGAGVVGIAIGLGSQSLVRDFIAGVFIVVEDQYGVGDLVNLGEANGVVEKVTMRTTAVRDIEGVLWTVPNGEIRRVANRSQRWARAVVDVRVAYATDLERAVALMGEVARGLWEERRPEAGVLEEPEVLGIESFGEGAVVLRLTAKTEPGAQFTVARELRRRIKVAFDDAGIVGLAGPGTTPLGTAAPGTTPPGAAAVDDDD